MACGRTDKTMNFLSLKNKIKTLNNVERCTNGRECQRVSGSDFFFFTALGRVRGYGKVGQKSTRTVLGLYFFFIFLTEERYLWSAVAILNTKGCFNMKYGD